MLKAVTVIVILSTALVAAEGYGGFSMSIMMPKVDSINARLQAHNFPALSKNQFALGGGGWGGDKIVLGGSGFGGFETVENDSMQIEASYGGGFFEAGYVIPIVSFLRARPILGLGGTGYTMHFRPRLGDVSFDSLLVHPGRTSSIEGGGFALMGALGITIPIQFIGIDIKGGYIFSPSKVNWSFEDGSKLLMGPYFKPGGLFVTVSFVFGGNERMAKKRLMGE
jgi:hypothetical protein